MNKSNGFVWICASWAAALLLNAYTVTHRDFMKNLFVSGSYFILTALVLFWIAALLEYWTAEKHQLRPLFSRNKTGLVFCLVMAALIFVSVRVTPRILADETNVLAVSRAMAIEKKAVNPVQSYWYYDNFYWVGEAGLDTRAMLTSYLQNVMHAWLGLRFSNPFTLNFAALAALFALIYLLLVNRLGGWWAACCVLLVASQPVLCLAAAAGGVDLPATFFLTASIVSLWVFLSAPSERAFRLTCITLVLYANTRSETVFFGVAAVLVVVALDRARLKFLRPGPFFCALPFLMSPLLWQRLLTNDFRLRAYEGTKGSFRFSLEDLRVNTLDFLKCLTNFEFEFPYASALILIGFASCVYFGARALRSIHTPPDDETKKIRDLFVAVTTGMIALWCIVSSNHTGWPTHAVTSRYYLPFTVFFTIAGGVLIWRLGFLGAKHGLLLSAFAYVLYHPFAIEDRWTNTLLLKREYDVVEYFLKKQPHKNFICVYERPGIVTANGYGALSYHKANADSAELLDNLKRNLCRDIYVIQKIEYSTNLPTAATQLDAAYRLETIAEVQNNYDVFLRISRVLV